MMMMMVRDGRVSSVLARLGPAAVHTDEAKHCRETVLEVIVLQHKHKSDYFSVFFTVKRFREPVGIRRPWRIWSEIVFFFLSCLFHVMSCNLEGSVNWFTCHSRRAPRCQEARSQSPDGTVNLSGWKVKQTRT